MVERVSQPVQFNTGKTTQIQSAAGGIAPMKVDGTSRQIYVDAGRMSSIGAFLGKSMVELGGAAFDRATTDAYLKGAAQIGTAESEATLETNPLTSDWTKAGYRDASFKLVHAKEIAKLEEDMKTLREKDLDAFNLHMQSVRDKLTPQLDGMSSQARQQAVAQMVNTQELAYNTYTRERQKYIVDVESSANMADYQSKLLLSQKARMEGTPQEYANATGTLLSSVTGMYTNPRLPQEVRNNLVYEAAEAAIKSGDTALWGAMKELPYAAGDGSKAPLLDRLPYQMQTKLADAARQAQQNNMTDQKMGYLDQLAQREAAWQSGQDFDLSADKALIDQGARMGWVQPGAYNSLLQSMYIATNKQKGAAALVQNYQTSVVGDADLAGKTKKEVRDAWVSQLYRSGKSDDQVIDALITNGTKVGNVESLELVGASVKPIMQKLSSADAAPLTPVENQRLSKVLTTLNELTVQNKQGAVAAMLSGMPEEQRVFMETVRTKVAGGILNDAAIREAGTQLRASATLSAKDRTALYDNQSKDDTAKVTDLVKGGFTSWLGTKFTLGAQGDLRSQLVAQRSTGVMATAMLEEMRSLGVANPGTTSDVRFNVAMANVSQRLVPTGDYQMLMPKGVSVQQFFGVDATQSNERIGTALQGIAKRIPEFKDKALYFTPGVDGRVQIDAWSKDRGEEGAAMFQSFTVEATQVKDELKSMDAKLAAKSNRIFGDGKTFTQGAASVNYNGMSSTTVDPNAMYKFRSNLVKNEGVRDTVYKDSQGNPTAGVGVANEFMPKPGPDGKISQADINLSFAKASDAAANAAVKIQNQTGLRGDKWFLLVGELAYQSGPGFTSIPQYQGMLSAIRTGDVATATAALQKTPAYRRSGPERKTHYERLLSNAMNN